MTAAASPAPPHAPERLAVNRDFQVLLSGQGISALGDAVSFTALPLLVFALTHSGLAMGIVGALETLPDLLFGMVAGALADRGDQKRMMFATDLGRGVLTALIPLSAVLHGPTLGLILLVAAPMSVLRSLFLAAYTASVPSLVGRSQLAQANSYFEAVYSVGFIIGPALAGLLSATIGPGPTLAVDAASFAISAVAIQFVERPLRAPQRDRQATLRAEIREGIEYIVGQPTLRAAILFWGIASVVSAGYVPALVAYITRDLHLPDSALGGVLAAFGAGTVVGSLLVSRARRGPIWPQLLGANVIRALALVGIAVFARIEVVAVLAFVAGVMSSLVLVTYITLRTAYAPDELLGRVGSTARTISLGMQPIGMLATGVLIDLTNGATTIGAMGVAMAVCSLLFFPVRALRQASLSGR